MLRRTPSLALRASLIFTAVYASILLAAIGTSAAISWASRGETNLRGAVTAVDYAAAELRETNGRLQIPANGRFADLAKRNPTLWLVALKDGQAFTSGPVGRPALQTVIQLRNTIESVMLRLPGQSLPLGAAMLERRDLASGPVVLAAGGVDPQTLSTRESIHLLLEPEVALTLIVIAVISLIATLIAVPAFARALMPITTEASAIGPQDPGRRLQESRAPRELLPLVSAFNAALDRLEGELRRRKRLIADVAHELRTPLAVVSLQAEALADGESKADLQRGLRRLTSLVAQMLDLERLSLAGQQQARLDLTAVARDAVADLAPMAIAGGYDLSLTNPDAPVEVTGDAHAIARALTNLIGNAILHGGGAGAITVRVAADRTIDVQDEGPGVPANLEPLLFEPFTRGKPDAEGCGLGLHLTREIMRSHGGEICLLERRKGAAFRLSFPPPHPDRPVSAKSGPSLIGAPQAKEPHAT